MAEEKKYSRTAINAASMFSYFGTGVVLAIVGPNLPAMGRAYGVSIGTLGLLFTCLLGGTFATFFFGFAVNAYGAGRVMTAGTAILTAGLAVAGTTHLWAVAPPVFIVIGLGLGMIDVGTNSIIPQVNGDKSPRYLSLLHMSFGVGAVSGPMLAGGLLERHCDYRVSYLVACALIFVSLVVFLAIRYPAAERKRGPETAASLGLLRNVGFMLLALVMFGSIGCEMSMNAWLFSFVRTDIGAGIRPAAAAGSMFWGGLLTGRLASSFLSVHVGARKLLWFYVGGSALGLAGVALSRVPAEVYAGAFFTGLCISAQVPLLISVSADEYKKYFGAATGMMFATGGLGGTLIPPAVGFIAERTALRTGIACLIPVALLMVLMLVMRRFMGPRSKPLGN